MGSVKHVCGKHKSRDTESWKENIIGEREYKIHRENNHGGGGGGKRSMNREGKVILEKDVNLL